MQNVFRLLVGCLILAGGLGLTGCGDKSLATVVGKVTFEGQPIDTGAIAFYPEGGNGPTGGGMIDNGEYKAVNVALGKNRVVVTAQSAEAVEANADVHGRGGADAQRRKASRKKEKSTTSMAIPKDAINNNQIFVVAPGTNQLDIDLRKPAGKK